MKYSIVAAPHLASALLVALLPAVTDGPRAQERQTVSLTVLDVKQGLRNIGMGETGVSDIGSTTAYYNPAAVAWADGLAVSVGHQDYHLGYNRRFTDLVMVVGHRWSQDTSQRGWRLGGSLGYTTYKSDPFVYLSGLDDYCLTYALAGAWEQSSVSVGMGVAAKYVKFRFGYEDIDVWALDYGFMAAWPLLIEGSLLRPRIGVSVANKDGGFTRSDGGVPLIIQDYEIAGETRAGFGFDFATPEREFWKREVALASAAVNMDYTNREDGEWKWAAGWEISVLQLVHARAGFRWYEDNYTTRFLGIGFGWEFGRWMVLADYAHVAPASSLDIDVTTDVWGATLGARF